MPPPRSKQRLVSRTLRVALVVIAAATTTMTIVYAAPTNSTSSNTTNADACSSAPVTGRQDCGYVGIDEDGCGQRQCCWNPSTVSGVPWCFQIQGEDYQCVADMAARRDCGYMGIGAQECTSRNCCWDATQNTLNAPFCFIKQYPCQGYQVSSPQSSAQGLVLNLNLIGTCARFGQDIPHLAVHVDFETESRVRVRILDRDSARYEIPVEALPDPQSTARPTAEAQRLYSFSYTQNPFSFAITRKSDGEKVFDTNVTGMDSLIFEDQYLEISSTMPNDANVYGLGEVVSAFRRNTAGTRQTLWTRDAPTPVDQNLYGSHPFHVEMRTPSGGGAASAHGVFLRNSNGMDVLLTPGKITYKTIGGILDFSVFVGPTPAAVIDQYTEVIGRPHMPPAWAMGFHQSRYGYKNISAVETVVQKYRDNKLPLDGVWIDIDYMDQFRDFTFDPIQFPQAQVQQLASDLAGRNQSMVLIVDPGIPIAPGYAPYDEGIKEGVFIMNLTGQPIEGRVWPGQTYFPDFMNTNETWNFWERQLQTTRTDIGENVYPWIDMNEPSNFCNGPCTSSTQNANGEAVVKEEKLLIKRDGNSSDPTPGPQYLINNAGNEAPLDQKTLAENAVHKNGLKLIDTHNMYGHMEAKATHNALTMMAPSKRPFLLTRSTFAGTGAYAAHWTGDNWSQWIHLYYSIPGILSFGLFGIPFAGSDICGFNGDTTEELCLRWHQLGSLYPFSRNHNDISSIDQEPYIWPTTVLPATQQALGIRYSLLPYYYTLHELAHRLGTPLWRPLWWKYTTSDAPALTIDRQFLLGDGILVSPALDQGVSQVNAYFPGTGRWFNPWTHQCVIEADSISNNNTGTDPDRNYRYKSLSAIMDQDPIPMSVSGGSVIPTQTPAQMTVALTRLQPVTLVIALDENGHALGEMYVDDGETPIPQDNSLASATIQFEVTNGQNVTGQAVLSGGATAAGLGQFHSAVLDSVVVLGLNYGVPGGELGSGAKATALSALNVNGVSVSLTGASVNGTQGQDPATGAAWVIDSATGSLTLSGLKMELFGQWFVQWVTSK